MNRRHFLTTSAAALSVTTAALTTSVSLPAAPSSSFQFVHFTDCHIQPEMGAQQGVHQAFDHIAKQKADFCLSGGDLVFDALEVAKPRAKSLYDMYLESTKRVGSPIYTVPGNHDYFGVFTKSGVEPSDPSYGQKMFEDRIGKRYQSFDHKGWHFILLDSIFITEDRKYKGFIDDAQLTWLKQDLESNKTKPIIVMTHIPLVTAALQTIPEWHHAGAGIACENGPELATLFTQYPVKMVLQGHTHINEKIDWLGTQYITTGAVSGNWWKGLRYGIPEGYAVITIKGDKATWSYESYGWKAVTA